MEFNSILSNRGLDLRFMDLTYEVNTWTYDAYKIGMDIYCTQIISIYLKPM